MIYYDSIISKCTNSIVTSKLGSESEISTLDVH